MDMKTDAELIECTLSGEWRNYAILVDKYKAKVYSHVFYLIGNREDTEEIVQDSFVKAYHSLGKFRGEASFATWVTRIAHFASLTKLRLKSPKKVDLQNAQMVVLEDTETLSNLHKSDRNRVLFSALEQLKPDERSVVTLFYYNEYSLKEISEITQFTISNVKIILHRSRKKLLGVLKKMGVTEDSL